MKNILAFLSIKNLKENTIKTFKRFPVSSILLLWIFLMFIYLNNFREFWILNYETLSRISLSLITTFFFSVGLYIFAESEKYKFLKTQGIQIISVIFGVGFYLFFGNNFNYESIIFFIITTFGILSFIFFAGFLKEIFGKNKENNNYYSYFIEVIKVLCTSLIIGFLSSLLGLMAINSIIYLFDFRFSTDTWKWVSNWMIFSCSLFAPFYALSNIVKKENIKEDLSVNTVSSFFVNYIIFPFVITFFIILYAYSIKVLANFGDWPKGQVSWMVISFSAFAYLAYIASYKTNSKNIAFLRKIIPFAVIPQTFMLFYAIYVRIANYGLTINRYLIVVFGVTLLCISLYLIFSKRKFLAVIPFLLTIFSIFISVGPWSIYNLPQKNQLQLLKQDLQKANILQKNGEITPLENYDDIDKNLGKNIYSKIRYLCDYDDCSEIKKLFAKEYKNLKKEGIDPIKGRKTPKFASDNPSKWQIVDFITKEIKVKDYYDSSGNKMVYFYADDNSFLNIKGYDTYIKIPNYYNNSQKTHVNIEKNQIEIIKKIKINNGEVSEIKKHEENIIIPFDLKEKVEQEVGNRKNKNIKEEIIVKFEVGEKKYKLIVKYASLKKDGLEYSKYDKERIDGVLLIGEK